LSGVNSAMIVLNAERPAFDARCEARHLAAVVISAITPKTRLVVERPKINSRASYKRNNPT
jgi:hypothetical protein